MWKKSLVSLIGVIGMVLMLVSCSSKFPGGIKSKGEPAPEPANPITIQNPDTTPEPVITSYVVGQVGPAGGLIFYVDSADPNLKLLHAGETYLEAAPTDLSVSSKWGCYGTPIFNGAQGLIIGAGKQNTLDIIDVNNGCSETNIAAKLCDALNVDNGQIHFNGWFLPSQAELNKMYEELYLPLNIGGFENSYYLSSSEDGDIRAWGQEFLPLNSFNSGAQSGVYKDKGQPLVNFRCIRAF